MEGKDYEILDKLTWDLLATKLYINNNFLDIMEYQ